MARDTSAQDTVNVMIVGQSGRLQYEAVLFASSLEQSGTSKRFKLYVAVPQPGPLWSGDPSIRDADALEALTHLGATLVPFENRYFGETYPYGNKIEALAALPKGEPFVFFDTDTLILNPLDDVPFDFERPTASMKREGTWPKLELYGPGYGQIWKSLYDKFGLDYESSLDLSQPDEYWQRYLYFNAGFFFYKCPHAFGRRFLEYAVGIAQDAPEEVVCQVFDPWLDQVALPLVIHSFGGGRETLPEGLLDGSVSCHYRTLPLLFARESDAVIEALQAAVSHNKVKKALKKYEPFKKLVFQNKGEKIRALFDQNDLPRKEQAIRNKIKREGYWMR